MESKYESVFRLLLAFMTIDWHVDEKEKKMILDFLTTKYWQEVPNEAKLYNYHKWKMWLTDFRKDAEIIYNNFTREEIFEILDFMSNMVKSDWIVDNREVELFEILLEEWKIERVIAEMLWIKKSLWNRFFK
ncbi:MAG: hypothetical protein ACD_49C00055G0007 [uncultured bacterium (gcode 4)]|uniref:Co-chaperone DjlA N-terminal domain-containing protein n=1 Tax=uncultured bacterium (gcode 4) TaxID=1234023 RepID=K2ADY8_9BACT|nr:MAG: hypothetical protein ACD_49C00055G0007 [uncultured bacterium (gcode 4)]